MTSAVPAPAKQAIALLAREAERIELRRRDDRRHANATSTRPTRSVGGSPRSRGIGPIGALNLALRVDGGAVCFGAPFCSLARGWCRANARPPASSAWAGSAAPATNAYASYWCWGRLGAERAEQRALGASRWLMQWLMQLLERKPRKLAAVALANKMARIVWAMMSSGEAYRPRPAAAA